MATSPLGPRPLPFKIPTGFDALKAIDAEFWRLHGEWRQLEDDFENHPKFPDEDPESEAMLDRASDARDAMFLRGVWTAAALLMKLEACEEGPASSVVAMELRPGITVFDVIQWDCERIFQREAGWWEPMLAI